MYKTVSNLVKEIIEKEPQQWVNAFLSKSDFYSKHIIFSECNCDRDIGYLDDYRLDKEIGTAVQLLTNLLVTGNEERVLSRSQEAIKLIIRLESKLQGSCDVKNFLSLANSMTEACKSASTNLTKDAVIGAIFSSWVGNLINSRNCANEISNMCSSRLSLLGSLPDKFYSDIIEMVNLSSHFIKGSLCETQVQVFNKWMTVRGRCDFLTEDGLWEMKVSKYDITSENALQILLYWILGIRSLKEEFLRLKKIGVFNPRFNLAYFLFVEDLECKEKEIFYIENRYLGYSDRSNTSIDIIKKWRLRIKD